MIGRRKRPDGLPFRLYAHYGKHKVSFGYKLPNGRWAFRLSAPARQKDAVAEIRKQAIERAEALNGDAVEPGTFEALAEAYFDWQEGLPHTDERRKAQITLDENRNELKRLVAVFGKMSPASVKPKHVYGYLDKRAQMGAPAKANKEVALLSAILEFGRRRGEVETNPCRGIEYNPTRPRQRYVRQDEIDLALEVARLAGVPVPCACTGLGPCEKKMDGSCRRERAAASEQASFQQRVQAWMLACFGAEISADKLERNHRFFEEAGELVQACGMTREEAHALVDYTWSRPGGEPTQEVGGVMVTLAALCLANGLCMDTAGETELARINVPATIAKIHAKQAAKPKHSPLPGLSEPRSPYEWRDTGALESGDAR